MLLLSVDQCSLLLLLSEMSEVLNHNGDSITLEIIVLLPAEAPSPSSLSAHPLSLRQILWTNEFPALIMNPSSCLTHYGGPTDIRNPLTSSNNPLFSGPSTCEAVIIKSLLEIKSDLDLDFFSMMTGSFHVTSSSLKFWEDTLLAHWLIFCRTAQFVSL